jgi:hypothetical protein
MDIQCFKSDFKETLVTNESYEMINIVQKNKIG